GHATSNYWGAASMNLFDLNGRVAIITGGNAGIGFGIAKGLATAGSAIVVAGRRADKNLEAARALETLNVKTAALEVDVSFPKIPSGLGVASSGRIIA